MFISSVAVVGLSSIRTAATTAAAAWLTTFPRLPTVLFPYPVYLVIHLVARKPDIEYKTLNGVFAHVT
jgi:hypothetical protein